EVSVFQTELRANCDLCRAERYGPLIIGCAWDARFTADNGRLLCDERPEAVGVADTIRSRPLALRRDQPACPNRLFNRVRGALMRLLGLERVQLGQRALVISDTHISRRVRIRGVQRKLPFRARALVAQCLDDLSRLRVPSQSQRLAQFLQKF